MNRMAALPPLPDKLDCGDLLFSILYTGFARVAVQADELLEKRQSDEHKP
jgi:hypothetical protein